MKAGLLTAGSPGSMYSRIVGRLLLLCRYIDDIRAPLLPTLLCVAYADV